MVLFLLPSYDRMCAVLSFLTWERPFAGVSHLESGEQHLSERTHAYGDHPNVETNSTQITLLTAVNYCLILEDIVSEID